MAKLCRAFTLIELLMVVAIIAILAAIAVPNFLEARTRSKVSRVYADMRTIANAIRMYEVDWNDTLHQWHTEWVLGFGTHRYGGGGVLYKEGANNAALLGWRLTTPIEYLSSIPLDICHFWSRTFNPEGVPISYILTSQKMGQEPLKDTAGFPYNWALSGAGPDGLWRSETMGIIGTGMPHTLDSWYDPTNGTISGGDINYWDLFGFQGGEY